MLLLGVKTKNKKHEATVTESRRLRAMFVAELAAPGIGRQIEYQRLVRFQENLAFTIVGARLIVERGRPPRPPGQFPTSWIRTIRRFGSGQAQIDTVLRGNMVFHKVAS